MLRCQTRYRRSPEDSLRSVTGDFPGPAAESADCPSTKRHLVLMDELPKSNVSWLSGATQVITEDNVPHSEKRNLACSFCRRTLSEIGCLIGTTIAFICSNCLKRYSALADEQARPEWTADSDGKLD